VKSYVYAVPDGIPEGGQILLTVYEDRELAGEELAPGDYRPEDRYEVATRPPIGEIGYRVWGPPLELETRS
jgi:hypothetical protein